MSKKLVTISKNEPSVSTIDPFTGLTHRYVIRLIRKYQVEFQALMDEVIVLVASVLVIVFGIGACFFVVEGLKLIAGAL
jgi:hypothetical protein